MKNKQIINYLATRISMAQTKLGFGWTLSTHSFDQFGEMQSDASDNLWNHTNMANLREKYIFIDTALI